MQTEPSKALFAVFGMLITSKDNPKIAEAAKLADKKYRRAANKYLVEGVRLVRDAIRYGADIESVFVREDSPCAEDFPQAAIVSRKTFAKLSDTVNSQGVCAVVRRKEQPLLGPAGNCLVLDGLQNPGNVGTLIRTAAACGFSDVYAADCVDLYSPKVIRSAMSAHFCIKLHEASAQEIFGLLDGVTVVAADMAGSDLFETSISSPAALVVGNEGNGLSDFVRQRVNATVALPMANEFESLNAAVAGSVIMYRIFTQNK